MDERELWRELGQQLRVDAVRASAKAGSGHPTSSMSAADLAAVLLAGHFRYDYEQPKSPANDRLIFSKGHASPLVYGLFRAAGAITEEEFMTYRQFGSRLEGHPTPVLPWVDVATGSLGQGLPIGVGLALAGKKLDRLPFRTWVICGDSELAEGSMWEALDAASFEQLDNLTAIVDVNRLGQRGETRHGWELDTYAERFRAFGWHAITIDGHDVDEIHRAYEEAEQTSGKPTAVIARTLKGKGYSKIEDQPGWHGKAMSAEDAEEALQELGGVRNIRVDVPAPPKGTAHTFETGGAEQPSYEVGSKIATRKAYGEALAGLGAADPRVVALDGEVDNSTYSEFFGKAFPERYFEMYIAEQQMVGAAVGMQIIGWKPFAATFAAFLSRAYDFVRMAAISQATIKLCGSHAGVSIGEDGPSQMALEDIASLRAINTSTVLYPCDGNQTAALVRAMADLDGISYLRTTRADTEVLYAADEDFPVGGSRTLREGDDVTLIGAGITLHEALKAAETLAGDGIEARVIDLYSVKPVDAETLRAITSPIVTVEDHRPEGGLGDAVLDALADVEERPRVVKLAVRELPHSGKPAELLAAAGIDAATSRRRRAGSSARRIRSPSRRAGAAAPAPRDAPRTARGAARTAGRAAAGAGATPSRSSANTAAPRAEASSTAESVTGRSSTSARICAQSGFRSSAPPLPTISSTSGISSPISASRCATPSSAARTRSRGFVSNESPETTPRASAFQPGLRSPPSSDRKSSSARRSSAIPAVSTGPTSRSSQSSRLPPSEIDAALADALAVDSVEEEARSRGGRLVHGSRAPPTFRSSAPPASGPSAPEPRFAAAPSPRTSSSASSGSCSSRTPRVSSSSPSQRPSSPSSPVPLAIEMLVRPSVRRSENER